MISLMHIKAYCKEFEKIENYDKAVADTTQVWHCHHRMEAVYTREELIKYGLYYDREPHQLIFLTKAEHMSLHHKGQNISNAQKRKISDFFKGNKNMLGKHHSEQAKEKIGAAHIGKHWRIENGKRVWY